MEESQSPPAEHRLAIEVLDQRENDKTKVPDIDFAGLIEHVLKAEDVPVMGVSLTLIDEESMHEINLEYMEEDRPTDVLSFPLDDPEQARADEEHIYMLGDLLLSPSYIKRQADNNGQTFQYELEMLCVHGTLHLLGYDHYEEEEKRVMFSLTDRLLESWRARS